MPPSIELSADEFMIFILARQRFAIKPLPLSPKTKKHFLNFEATGTPVLNAREYLDQLAI